MTGIATIPRVDVELDGELLAPEEARQLAQVRVHQQLGAPALCELVFVGPGAGETEPELPEPGRELLVTVAGAEPMLFAGDVTAVEHVYEPSQGRETRLRGYDLLHRLRKSQELRAHVQTTPATLAEELVGDLGLDVEAAFDGPRYRHLIQHGQSDFELLVQVAERAGLHATVREHTLHLLTLEGIGEEIPLELGDTLHEARIELNGDLACRSVSVRGWDPQLVEAHEASVSTARLGRDVPAEVDPGDVGGSGSISLADEAAEDEPHAEGLAQAELDVRAAREVSLWGIAEGDPRLRPGARVRVSGVDPRVAGTYVLTSATHVVDERGGYLTELSSLPPKLPRRARGAIAALGKVTSVEDPEGAGRVRVSLPAYGGVETDWMSVVAAGAGSAKGLVMLPDVGDRVLLLFMHEDPSWGVVVGGLYGADGAPDPGVAGGAVRRYNLFTPTGHRLTFDDEAGSIRLESSAESYLDLSPDLVLLHSAQPLTLEAPGQPVVIRCRSVEFETAEEPE